MTVGADLRACRNSGFDPDSWFRADTASAAKRVCRTCPLRLECREYARTEGIPWGIWGGEDEQQRQEWWRKNGGRPTKFIEAIDDAVRPLLQARRDAEAVA